MEIKGQAAEGVPRIEVLARALDRVSRSVRRSVALARRMEAGWPRVGGSDGRAAMVRRQAAREAGHVIQRHAAGEAAERLFDELAERLADPAFEDEVGVLPVAEVVRLVCLDLGLAMAAVGEQTALPAGEGAWTPPLPPASHGPPPAGGTRRSG